MSAPVRKAIEWVPGRWWVVDARSTGYTPLYEGVGASAWDRRRDCERWLAEHPGEAS